MWEWGSKLVSSPSKTFALFAAMFCFGILLGPLFVVVSTPAFFVVLSATLLLSVFLLTKPQRLMAFAVFLFVFGLFRYAQSELPKGIPTVQDRIGEVVRVEGVVAGDPSKNQKSQQVILNAVRVGGVPVFGRILVSVPNTAFVAYGDRVVFACLLQQPHAFSGFAYDRYLASKGVYALCRAPQNMISLPHKSLTRSIFSFKHALLLNLQSLFVEPHASFLFGLVFGGSSGLDRDLQDDFAQTGTSHILAASGFNVSLFTFVFFGWVIQFLGKKRGAIATLVLLGVYVVMAGATAAVVRAAIFGCVLLFGSVIGRRAHMLNVLLLTGALMLLFNPRWLLDDVGFQLSFVAFAAIVFVAPKWKKQLEFIPDSFGIRDALAGSLSAIVLTLPIMIWQFGSVSLIAPFANVFVLPVVPFLMFAVLALIPFGWLMPSVAHILAVPVLITSRYVLFVIHAFVSLPFSSVSVPNAHFVAVVVGGGVLAATVAFFHRT